MIDESLAIVALFVLGFGAISGWIEKTIVTPPMTFIAFGLLVSPLVSEFLDLHIHSAVVDGIATATLALILFTDAARIDFQQLRHQYVIPLRLLGIGLPLTIIFGILAAIGLFPDLNIWEAAALATILAPTDAALGQAVVSSPDVPVRIRQALNVESGLNDGICLPLLLIALSLAESSQVPTDVNMWVAFGLAQVILGPIVGIAVGYVGGQVVMLSSHRHWMTENYERLSVLALSALAFCLAEIVGGNGFIAAFSAGLTLGNSAKSICVCLLEFGETEGQFLMLITFALYGSLMVPTVFDRIGGAAIAYAVLSLTAIRIVSVALSAVGTRLMTHTLLFLGWFGPRGIASVLYVLLVLDREAIVNREPIFDVVTLTVLFSAIAHGMTALPGARWYARFANRHKAVPGMPEHIPAAEIPVRLPFRSRLGAALRASSSDS